MLLHAILKRIPHYLSDLRDNFHELFINHDASKLSYEQMYCVSIAISYVLKNELLINNFKYEAEIHMDKAMLGSIRAAAVMMTRNNIFYRSTRTSTNNTIKEANIGLPEKALSHSELDKITLMMCLFAISMLNNCQSCVQFYTDKLLSRNTSEGTVLHIAKMVAVLKAVSEVLEIEAIRSYDFMPRGENI